MNLRLRPRERLNARALPGARITAPTSYIYKNEEPLKTYPRGITTNLVMTSRRLRRIW